MRATLIKTGAESPRESTFCSDTTVRAMRSNTGLASSSDDGIISLFWFS